MLIIKTTDMPRMSLPESDVKEIEDIIGSIKQNFECPICLELMVNPVSTKCDHKFCRHCILEVVSRKPSVPCPLCKTSVTKRSLQELIEWKNFVKKVKQLIDAFKLDLAEEDVSNACGGSARKPEVASPSPGQALVLNLEQGTASVLHLDKRRKSVRFKIDVEELNTRQGLIKGVEVQCNGNNLGCTENTEVLSLNNETSLVASDTPREPVPKKTSCLRNESGCVGFENNAVTKCSGTGVDALLSSDDDDSRGLITGGYKAGVDFDVEMKPVAENHKIFKSRALLKGLKPTKKKPSVHSVDDPYAFIGSQPTPKRKKSIQGQMKGEDGINMFEDLNILPKRRKRMSVGETSGLRLPAMKKHVTEANNPTGNEFCNEIQALSDKISDAEGYNLVLSQQFKNSNVENKKNKKLVESTRPRKNRVCDQIFSPLALTENQEELQKIISTVTQRDSEEIQAVPLEADETLPKQTVAKATVRNETAPKKVVPHIVAPNRTVPKESVLSETIPSKISTKSPPNNTLSKQADMKEVIPNELIPSKTIPSEILSSKMLSSEIAPNAVKTIVCCLETTGVPPPIDVSFAMDSSLNSGATKVCETDSDRSSDTVAVVGNDVSVTYSCLSSKQRKCSEIVKQASEECQVLTSRKLLKTRSSSRRRSPLQMVENKWQKEHQRNRAAKEERRKAIEEFERLQDMPMSNSCTGVNQKKNFMGVVDVAPNGNGETQGLEEERAFGEMEEQPTGEEKSSGRLENQTTQNENRFNGLEEQPKAVVATETVESSSKYSISSIRDSVESQAEEYQCTEQMNETAEDKNAKEMQPKAVVAIANVESSSPCSISSIPGSVENQTEENQCARKTNETTDDRSAKETLQSDSLFSENRKSDILCKENKDNSLLWVSRGVTLENDGATDNRSTKNSQFRHAPAVPDDTLRKSKRKRKTFSLETSSQGCDKTLLSESSRTTANSSMGESQCRDSLAAPPDLLPKSKAKRKRKTFSLEASPVADKQMKYSLPTDSIDIEQVIGEAVLGMLGDVGDRGLASDDLSTQEIEIHEAALKLGQVAKGNRLGCDVGTVVDNGHHVAAAVEAEVIEAEAVEAEAVEAEAAETEVMEAEAVETEAVEADTILASENESASTEAAEEKIENGFNRKTTEEVVNDAVLVNQDNRELFGDHSSNFVECTMKATEHNCVTVESQADVIVEAGDSSSTHSNSYSLLQPPVSVVQDKNCTDSLLKDPSVKVHYSTESLQGMRSDSCQTIGDRAPAIGSAAFVGSKRMTDLKSDELKVCIGTKSLLDLVPITEIEKVNSQTDNWSRKENESNLVVELRPKPDSKLVSELTSVNEQKLATESKLNVSFNARKSVENLTHQLSSICDQAGQGEKYHSECVEIETKTTEEKLTFLEDVQENDSDDVGDDEIASPISRTNLTSSSNLSSESEMLTTQQRHDLEVEVRTMEEEIARLQAELNKDVQRQSDKTYVPAVVSETNNSDEKAYQPEPGVPVSSRKNIVQSENCGSSKDIRDITESDSLGVVQESPNNVITDKKAEHKDDGLETDIKQDEVSDSAIDDGEASSEADLFGSQMSDIVAIPQTPTPTKGRTPRKQFVHRDLCGMERSIEGKESPRSPTPPPSLLAHKKEKKNSDDLEFVNKVQRSKLSYKQEVHGRASSMSEKRWNGNKNLDQSYDKCKASIKTLEKEGNHFRNVSQTSHLVNEGIATCPKTPENRGSLSTVATTGKRFKDTTSTSAAVLRECSSQPLKQKHLATPFPQKKNWILVASGINRSSEMPLVEEFVRKLGCRFLQKFTNGTTHVLVKPVKDGSRLCQRTLKYFQGIAHRSWVISVEWVIDSIKMGHLQPEEKYEITGDVAVNEDHFGPTNARLSGVQLLRKFEICCLGAFDDLTRDDLRGLAEACGASSLQDPAMFSFDVDRAQVIIVEGSSGDTGLLHFKKLYKKFSVPIVAKEWLLDSVGTYDVKSLDEYAIYPLPS